FDLTKKKFFISGSSSAELSINSLSYLVGRIRIIEVFPLTFKEFLEYENKNLSILLEKKRSIEEISQFQNLFAKYLKYGGYPKVVLSIASEKEKTLSDLVNTYLLKEIRDILD